MTRTCLYFRRAPEQDRWLPGDRFLRSFARRAIRGKPRPSGIDKVFTNLCLGLERIGVTYNVNLPFRQLRDDDRVGVLGVGRHALAGYEARNPIVAGIALMSHPSEWPTLCEEYPITTYLQHSEWANNIYKPYFGDRCRIWPVGIDTIFWCSAPSIPKKFDFLIYDKIMWQREETSPLLLGPIRKELEKRGLSYTELRYGSYTEQDYKNLLSSCRSMIFLCEHESQGIGYLEALASDVPILAWDQGRWLDPNRYQWGDRDAPATSVPYFDRRCGLRFGSIKEFVPRLTEFLDLEVSKGFRPRDYILENLTLEGCAMKFLNILDEARFLGAL